MPVGNAATPLTRFEPPKHRTQFDKPKIFGQAGMSAEERELDKFVLMNRTDVAVFMQTKTTEFLRNWIKQLSEGYKDTLASNSKVNADTLRGIIAGTKEIITMFDWIEKTWKNQKNGGKDNDTGK